MKTTIVTLPTKKRLKTKKSKKRNLVKDLDTVFSRWIRLSNSDEDGMVQCYTCGHFTHYKKIHAGHYISRYYKGTRWDERNVRPQCFMCNIYKKGNSVIFRSKLIEEYGDVVVEEMEKSVHELTRGVPEEMDSKIAFYQDKLIGL